MNLHNHFLIFKHWLRIWVTKIAILSSARKKIQKVSIQLNLLKPISYRDRPEKLEY